MILPNHDFVAFAFWLLWSILLGAMFTLVVHTVADPSSSKIWGRLRLAFLCWCCLGAVGVSNAGEWVREANNTLKMPSRYIPATAYKVTPALSELPFEMPVA